MDLLIYCIHIYIYIYSMIKVNYFEESLEVIILIRRRK